MSGLTIKGARVLVQFTVLARTKAARNPRSAGPHITRKWGTGVP